MLRVNAGSSESDSKRLIMTQAARQRAILVIFVVTVLAYGVSAQLGLQLIDPARKIALFWPAAGIAVGLMASVRTRHVPVVALAIFTAALAANLAVGKDVGPTLVLSLANAFEAMTAAFLLHGLDRNDRFRLTDLVSLRRFLLSTVAAVAIGGGISTFGLYLTGEVSAPLLSSWLVWVLGNGVGILTLAPLIIVATDRSYWFQPERPWETAGAITVLGAVLLVVIQPDRNAWYQLAPLAVLAPPLLWIALRGNTLAAASAPALTALAIVAGTVHGLGPFADAADGSASSFYAAQAALTTASIGSLAVHFLLLELQSRNAELSSLLKEAPLGLAFFDDEYRYLRINDELASINGIPAPDHLGRTITELLPVNAVRRSPGDR
ncbi:MASE1 domain-containing protein [Sphingomonas lutea]|uniref:MASE1 domain-containing protein n=1 Tax=Sphingomonas lutea TaxID=1045317 RepID=UPI001F27DFE4|nr:MASE1 domain-containing protein [Sphingomonas lutea]